MYNLKTPSADNSYGNFTFKRHGSTLVVGKKKDFEHLELPRVFRSNHKIIKEDKKK